MDKLNCFKKPTTRANNTKADTRKVCIYQDEEKLKAAAALKKRQKSKGSCKPGFHLHHCNDSATVRDSMQYYRVWIYSCNVVLGLASVIFIVFAAFVLADVRLSLLRGFEFYHPTFLYAYVALIVQCGVIQTIGCFGAQRLSHKLLSIYWIILLVLTLGDIVVGVVWVFKLKEVQLGLQPSLTKQFLSKYSIDSHFTETWNAVQAQEHCCGVDGPIDFDKFITSSIIRNSDSSSSTTTTNDNYMHNDGSSNFNFLPSSSSTANPTSSSPPPSLASFYLALPDSCCMTISYPITSSFPLPIQNFDQSSHNVNNNNNQDSLSSSSHSSKLNSIVKRQIFQSSPNNLDYNNTSHNNPNSEELLYGSRFINSKLLKHHHHLRHFVHPRKSSPLHSSSSNSNLNYTDDGLLHSPDELSANNHNNNNDIEIDSDQPIVLERHPSITNNIHHQHNNNNEQLTELLIPFSCRNPLHSQIHQLHHSHSNLPVPSFTKSFSNSPINYHSRRSVAESENKKDADDSNNDHLYRPSAFSSSNYFMTNDNQPNFSENEDAVESDESNQEYNAINSNNNHNINHRHHHSHSHQHHHKRRNSKRHASSSSSTPSSSNNTPQFKHKVRIYRNGCYSKLTQWLDHVSGILFILGFCVVGFVKVCFLIILRHEIREMIEKIHLLETEGSADGILRPCSPSNTLMDGGLRAARTSIVALNFLQKQHSLQSNSYNLVQQPGHFTTGITIKSPELSNSSPFINLNCTSASHLLYHHHHHLPPYYAQQHRHSTTPYWSAGAAAQAAAHHRLLQHRGSHCGIIGTGGGGYALMNTSIGSAGSSSGGQCSGRRRPSGRSLNEMDIIGCNLSPSGGVGDVCCSNHSQETVNMTLLITTPSTRRGSNSKAQKDDLNEEEGEIGETSMNDEKGGGGGGATNENISLKVPVSGGSGGNKNSGNSNDDIDQHEIRRSNFANHYCTWDSNVSCDSSTSNIALDGSVSGGVRRDHSSSSSLQGLFTSSPHGNNTGNANSAPTTQLVKVDLENHRSVGDGIDDSLCSTNLQYIDEDTPLISQINNPTTTGPGGSRSNNFSNNPMITYQIEDNNDASNPADEAGASNINNETVINVDESNTSRRLNRQPLSTDSGSTTGGAIRLLAHANSNSSSTGSSGPGLRRNGNNNSVDSGQSVDSDYIMSFIGTAV